MLRVMLKLSFLPKIRLILYLRYRSLSTCLTFSTYLENADFYLKFEIEFKNDLPFGV